MFNMLNHKTIEKIGKRIKLLLELNKPFNNFKYLLKNLKLHQEEREERKTSEIMRD